MVPKMEACLQAVHAAASPGPPSSTAASRTPCCSSSSPTRASAPRCCPASPTKIRKALRHRPGHDRPQAAGYAGALMNTFGPPQAGARPRRGRPRLGRRRQRSTSTCSAASPSTRSATPTRRSSRRSPTQLRTLGHVSNFFATEPQVDARRAAARACWAPAPGRVFFTNSGAEANEAAFKLTRRTGRTHAGRRRGRFHGRTMGALALTAKAAYREPFEPLPGRRHLRAVRRRRRPRRPP